MQYGMLTTELEHPDHMFITAGKSGRMVTRYKHRVSSHKDKEVETGH